MAKRKKEALSVERIEIAALDLIESEGLSGFSTRKLAAKLGCEAMSIYHYYPNKAHLMDALLDRAISEIDFLDDGRPWRERLRHVGYAYRAMAHRHPAFFQFMAHHRMNTRSGLRFLERVLTIFNDAGFDIERAAREFRAFSYYVLGAALDETSGYAKGVSTTEPVPDDEASRDYPLVTAVNPYFKPAHHDKTFALGLEILLDGFEAELAADHAVAS